MAGSTDVVVKFLADTSDIAGGVKNIDSKMSGLGKTVRGLGLAIGGAFAVKQIHDFIDAGAQLEDVMAAAEVIFGDASKAVIEFGDTAAESMGMAKTAAIDSANTFAALGKSAGLTGDDLAEFSTGMVALAADLASFRGTKPEEAIEAIGAALRGEAEPIRKYGVLLSEGALKARALSMGLVEATGDVVKVKTAQIAATKAAENWSEAVAKFGPDSKEAKEALDKLELSQLKLTGATEGTIPKLTDQQKVLATQAEILAQTTDAQGDFARTSDSAANSQKILKAQIEDVKTEIGTALLPIVVQLLPYLQKMAEYTEKNAGWMVPLALGIGVVVIGVKAWIGAQTLLNGVLATFGVEVTVALGPILLITFAILAAYIAVGLLYAKWDWVWNKIGNMPWYAKVALFIFAITNPVLLLIIGITFLLVKWEQIWEKIVSIAGWAKDRLDNILGFILDIVEDIINAAGKIKDVIDKIPGASFVTGLIPGLGAGGIVTKPTLAMIGEAGPEAVIPLSRMTGSTSGGATNVTINVTTTGLGADAPSIQSAVVAALRQYTTRNGPLPALITGR